MIDNALDDSKVCAFFGISKPTLNRWRASKDFPKHDFFVGNRGFTWEATVKEWIAQQPTTSPIAGRSIPSKG